jgi:signal transduction histidine kinase
MELHGSSSSELDAALNQVERLQDTVGTLLALARDAPRGSALTPLQTLLDDVEQRWHGPLAADGRPLQVRIGDGVTSARGSPTVLREILDVLLDNAHRHGAGAVGVDVRRTGRFVAIDVSDEGLGPAVAPDELFARRRASADGHGIGLALARSLAYAEGAQLTLSQAAPPVFTLLLGDE